MNTNEKLDAMPLQWMRVYCDAMLACIESGKTQHDLPLLLSGCEYCIDAPEGIPAGSTEQRGTGWPHWEHQPLVARVQS